MENTPVEVCITSTALLLHQTHENQDNIKMQYQLLKKVHGSRQLIKEEIGNFYK